MSLAGQWVSRYSGTNSGKLVIDIDDLGDRYLGTACLWDDSPELPCSLVRFVLPSKDTKHTLNKLAVKPIDHYGVELSDATIAEFKVKGFLFPDTADVEIELKGSDLYVSWMTSVGTSGTGMAVNLRKPGAENSSLVPLRVNSWDDFKTHVNGLPERRYIFRGHARSHWKLRSSFYRTGRANLERYLIEDVSQLQKQISGLTKHIYDLNNPLHYGAFANLVQHHGYPTPLLDWTWSPYIAAFFCYRNILKTATPTADEKVRIYQFDVAAWNQLPQFNKLFPIQPHLSVLDAVAFDNSRVIPQQGISTVSNVDDLETYIAEVEGARARSYLSVLDLSAVQRNTVMKELALMGITAASMFPGLDGACEALRERNF